MEGMSSGFKLRNKNPIDLGDRMQSVGFLETDPQRMTGENSQEASKNWQQLITEENYKDQFVLGNGVLSPKERTMTIN